jgi:hypothetical protein
MDWPPDKYRIPSPPLVGITTGQAGRKPACKDGQIFDYKRRIRQLLIFLLAHRFNLLLIIRSYFRFLSVNSPIGTKTYLRTCTTIANSAPNSDLGAKVQPPLRLELAGLGLIGLFVVDGQIGQRIGLNVNLIVLYRFLCFHDYFL